MNTVSTQVPGTVHLLDVEYTASVGNVADRLNLAPQPSDDPDDPLNWSKKRKHLAMACVLAYTIGVGVPSAVEYSVLENISSHTDLTLSTLNQGTGYMFLSFGWGCLFWQPLALQYGKRPVYLISTLGTMATMIWAPHSTSESGWICRKVLQGFFGAPIESLCGISVADLYFVHERGLYTTVYALVLSGSSTGAPIVSGFIAEGQGWRWVLYWCAILAALILCFLFLFMEESNYSRTSLESTTGTGALAPESGSPLHSPMTDLKAGEPDSPWTVESRSELRFLRRDSGRQSNKTWCHKWRLWQKDPQKPNQLVAMVTSPFRYATYPLVVFCGISYGSSLVWYNLLNASSSLILTKVYHFPTSMVGVSYIAVLFGVLVGAAYTGLYGGVYVMRRARQNGGVLESEHRLRLLIPTVVLLPGGFVLWGVGAHYHVHWSMMVLAMFLIAGASSIWVQESIHYCISAYPEGIVTVILIRNSMSFAASYGLTPWVMNLGLKDAFILAAVLSLLQCCSAIPVEKKLGQLWRGRSARVERPAIVGSWFGHMFMRRGHREGENQSL